MEIDVLHKEADNVRGGSMPDAPEVQPAVDKPAAAPAVTPAVVDKAVSAELRARQAESELASRKKAEQAAAREKLEAEQASAREAQATENTALKARAEKAEKKAKRQAAKGAMAGIKDFRSFYALVENDVSLDDDGELTEASTAALTAFREQHAYLFGDAAARPTGTTPGSSAPSRSAPTQYTAEEMSDFKQVGIKPGAWKQSKHNESGWLGLVAPWTQGR